MKVQKRCVIIAGGDVCEKMNPSQELILCADGGYRHALAQNIRPDVLIGDFDSYTDTLPENVKIVRYPAEKDVSDTWACVEYAVKQGYQAFEIYGAFGGDRIDHSIANLQLFRAIAEKNRNAVFHYGKQKISNINAGNSERIDADRYLSFSVFALSDICKGVTIKGAKYLLENAELKNSFPLGLSNEVTDKVFAEISVKEGSLMLVKTKEK